MAKKPRKSAAPARLDTLTKVVGLVLSLVTIASTILAMVIQLVNVQPSRDPAPDDVSSAAVSEAPVTYRGLDEFENDDSRLAYAADLLGQNQYRAAEAFLSEFLAETEPDSHLSVAICYDRGLARLYLREYNQAILDFSVVTAEVEYPDAYYNLGNALLGLDDYEKALEAYEHALELEQKSEYVEARDAVLALMN